MDCFKVKKGKNNEMQEVYHIEKLYTAQVIDLGRDYVEFPILQLTLLTYKRATE